MYIKMTKITFAQKAIIERIETKFRAVKTGKFQDLHDDYSDWTEYEEYYNDYADYFDSGYYEQPD